MAQIDDIDQQTIEIEKVARALDDYSRYLGELLFIYLWEHLRDQNILYMLRYL